MSHLHLASSAGAERQPARVAPPQASQYLIFSLAREQFGVNTQRVREIIGYRAIASVPMTPPYMLGVINLRGAVVPVVDVNARFGRAPTEVSRRTCIVILDVLVGDETHVLGIVVDSVTAVRQIDGSQIEPAPTFGVGIRADFIEGMAKVNGNFVILLDLGKVLSVDELAVAGLDAPAAD
ncbi:chemotaxis protein CheW [Derxia lacustris]|uniref:chemotaxis protein CheW n=1 Tax=Derxia lacustris TaxID=764842 RepID=UPI000A175628|nr:chemotaxis protein CheW [Derxia lacustris]